MQQLQQQEVQNEENVIQVEIYEPSIGRRRTINGKSYFVKSVFAGDKDFAKTIQELAIKQAYSEVK